MIRRIALGTLLAVGLFAAAPSDARPVNVPSGNPIVGLDVPAGWTTKPSKRGIEVRSPDEEIFFWVEVYLPADQAEVVGAHERYFAKQGVKPAGEPKVAKRDGTATDLPATYKGKPTVLRYLAIDPKLPAGNQILISYWASPEGDEGHGKAFDGIVRSLGAPR